MIIQVEGVSSKEEAGKLVGKKVEWTAPGKNNTKITWTVSTAHGNKGAVRATFERGMPGQSVGKKLVIE